MSKILKALLKSTGTILGIILFTFLGNKFPFQMVILIIIIAIIVLFLIFYYGEE